jgi:aspartate carbamoyltransferase catalytic subunit
LKVAEVLRHILKARQFNPDELSSIFSDAERMREASATREGRRELARRHVGTKIVSLFYEPSTRTRFSFESAALSLGMGVISTDKAAEFSSAKKGETLEDTIKTVGRLAHAVVLRHPEDDAADRAAAVEAVRVINGGSGKLEHPTQAVLDMHTIWKEKGRLDNLKVVMGGDLRYGRTVKSLAYLLSMYDGNHLSLVSTPDLQIGAAVTDHLDATHTSYTETDDMYSVIRDADVVYWTRLQTERLEDKSVVSNFVIDQAALQEMSPEAIIMQPFPRVGEIETSVDNDPRAKYFDQVENGLYVRMAMLDDLLADV